MSKYFVGFLFLVVPSLNSGGAVYLSCFPSPVGVVYIRLRTEYEEFICNRLCETRTLISTVREWVPAWVTPSSRGVTNSSQTHPLVEEEAQFQNTWKSWRGKMWSWVPTGRGTKKYYAGEDHDRNSYNDGICWWHIEKYKCNNSGQILWRCIILWLTDQLLGNDSVSTSRGNEYGTIEDICCKTVDVFSVWSDPSSVYNE
jgi:hypothetical protein